MAEVLEEVARVGLAGWVGESDEPWDTQVVLGVIGDDLYLVEIEASNRERMLLELIERYDLDAGDLRIEIAFFGDAGGFFASSLSFLALWPKSLAEVPAEFFIGNHLKAAFTKEAEELVLSVRHSFRALDAPPKRRFRFQPNKYKEAMSDLTRESRILRDDLLAVAQQRAPDKVGSLQRAFKDWPA